MRLDGGRQARAERAKSCVVAARSGGAWILLVALGERMSRVSLLGGEGDRDLLMMRPRGPRGAIKPKPRFFSKLKTQKYGCTGFWAFPIFCFSNLIVQVLVQKSPACSTTRTIRSGKQVLSCAIHG